MSEKTQQVEQDIKAAIESGDDVYQKVRDITLKALSEHDLDEENIKEVVQAIGRGITQGLSGNEQVAKKEIEEAAEALDDALVSAAEATKLAVEEAASTVKDFSENDIKKTLEDLKALEELFLDTLSEVAKESSEVVGEVVSGFVEHARNSGTAIGERVKRIAESLENVAVVGGQTVAKTAAETAAQLAKIGSGILAGIAESLQSGRGQK